MNLARPKALQERFVQEAQNLLHAPFYPADVREGEAIHASIRIPGANGSVAHDLRVWRVSPFGIELVLPPDREDLVTEGDAIHLELHIGREVSDYQGLVVKTRHRQGAAQLIGIRWYQDAHAKDFAGDRRRMERFSCGQEFLPTGVAPNPARFNDFIHFRVKDISSTGMQLFTSLRNKYLVPKMTLDSIISCPTIGQIKVRLKIVHARIVSEAGKDFLALGVEMVDASPQTKQVLGQYILQFGPPTSVEALKSSGLRVSATTKAVDYSFVRTSEEYEQVLELRKLAYSQVGKVDKEVAAEDMGDIFDTRARILIGKYKGQVIASLRIIYHEPDDPTEHEQFATFPADFPRKDEMVEVTRVCTHPDYRGSDLLMGLLKHLTIAVLQSNRRYILGSSTSKLLPLYTKIGLKPTSVHYRHADLGNEEHTIFIGDAIEGVSGGGVNPIVWNAMYEDVWRYMDLNAVLPKTPLVNVRLGIYRMFNPLTKILMRGMNKPRKAK